MNLCLVLTYLISIFRNTTAVEALWGYTTPKPINHNYTQCCIDESVPNECLGFCSIKNILEGTTGMNEWITAAVEKFGILKQNVILDVCVLYFTNFRHTPHEMWSTF